MGNKIYAVQKGRIPGVYYTWEKTLAQVKGYPGAIYKSFATTDEAFEFLKQNGYENQTSAEPKVPDTAYAFVDGSYNDATKVYGYGGFLVGPNNGGERVKIPITGSGNNASGVHMRNVAGEIKGAMVAIKEAMRRGYSQLTIFYDYSGIEAWATGAWKTTQEGTKAYKDFVEKAREAGISISFEHVKGHSGIAGNEQADKMAKAAVGVTTSQK